MQKEIETISKDELEQNRFKGMTPEKKIMLSLKLYYSARELKEASIRYFHPDCDNDKIIEEVRKIFLYARS